MPQPKNGLINLINNQYNRSDNDAPQDQFCFVVFMGFGVLWVSRLVCCGVLFFRVYRILTVGQIRSWVSTTFDADQV